MKEREIPVQRYIEELERRYAADLVRLNSEIVRLTVAVEQMEAELAQRSDVPEQQPSDG